MVLKHFRNILVHMGLKKMIKFRNVELKEKLMKA